MRKKLEKSLSILLSLAMIFSMLATTAVATSETWSGEGSESDPYQIADAADLVALANSVNNDSQTYSGEYFILTDDIDLDGSGISPIGNATTAFAGTFDGDGYSISNMSVSAYNNWGDSYAGLFGKVDTSGTVKNVTVSGSVYAYSNQGIPYAGGVVGYNSGTVINCGSTVDVSTKCNDGDYAYIGGVVGYNSGTVTNCYSTGTVNDSASNGGGSYIGGVAGSGGTVTNCYATGTITASGSTFANYAGGVTGSGTTTNCYYLDGILDSDTSNATSFTDYDELYTSLNEWIDEQDNSSDYLSWTQSSDGSVIFESDYEAKLTIDGANTKYETLTAALADANESGGTITLLKDVTTTTTLTITNTNAIILDLDGYDITNNGSSAVITVSGGDLTLQDTNSLNSTRYGYWESDTYQIVNTATTATDAVVDTLTGGIISGGSADSGGGIFINSTGGTVTMTGGNIAGNKANGSSGDGVGGGGVNIHTGTFNMSGGTIVGNSAVNNGGGLVNNNGTATIKEDAIITNNNAAKYGGGIYSEGTTYIEGGTISYNTATSGGGGVTADSGTTTMTGGTINYNSTNGVGDGVYHYKATLKLSGSPSISNNGTDDTSGDGVYINSGYTIKVIDGLTTTIPVTLGATVSDSNPVTVAESDGTYSDGKLTSTDEMFTKANSEANGSIVLLADEIQWVIWSYATDSTGATIVATSDSDITDTYDGGDIVLTAPTSLVYNGNAKEATLEDSDGDWIADTLTITYYDGTSETAMTANTYPTNAGSYTAKVFDPNNSTTLLASVTYTITAASVDTSGYIFTAPTDGAELTTLTYDGTGKTATVTDSEGSEISDLTIKYYKDGVLVTDDEENPIAPTDAGEYTVEISIPASGNSAAVEDYEIGEFTIAQKELTVQVKSTFDTTSITKEYNGITTLDSDDSTNIQSALEVVGLVGNDTVTVSGTWKYSDINVGDTVDVVTTNITLDPWGENTNSANYTYTYAEVSTTGSITPKALTLAEQSFAYTGDNEFTSDAIATGVERTVSGNNVTETVIATYTLTETTANAGADAGDYTKADSGTNTFTVVIGAGENTYTTITNYTIASAGTVTIVQASNSVSVPTISDLTVGETPAASGATATFGTVTYAYYENETDAKAGTNSTTDLSSAGTYYVVASVADDSDNYENATSDPVSFTVSYGTATLGTEFTLESPTTAGDWADEYTFKAKEGYTLVDADGKDLDLSEGAYVYTTEGEATITIYVKDSYGVISQATVSAKIDSTEPDAPGVDAGDYTSEDWTNGSVTITLSNDEANDGGSGFSEYQYSTNGTDWSTCTSPFTATESGTYYFQVVDNAGNVSDSTSIVVKIDETDPEITVTTTPSTTTWATSETISFTATDTEGSGVDTVTVVFDAGGDDEESYTVTDGYSFTADRNGTYTITVTDEAGNTETTTVTITHVDSEIPVVSVTEPTESGASLEYALTNTNDDQASTVTFTVSPSDNASIGGTNGDTLTITAAGTYVITATSGAGETDTYEITVYKVTFDENGGTAGTLTSTLVTSGGTVTAPTEAQQPTRSYYTFNKWVTEATGTTEFTFTAISASATAYATWTITPLVAADIDITTPVDLSPTYGTDVTLSAPADPDSTDTVTYEYQWYIKNAEGNWVAVEGETSADLTLSDVADNGEYCVGITVKDDADKESTETLSTETVTVAITPKVITELEWTGLDATYTYTGLDQIDNISASFTGVGDDGTITVTLTWELDSTGTEVFTNAGDYTITPEIADGNYVLATEGVLDASIGVQDVTMNPATLIAVWTNTTTTYTGEELAPDVELIGTVNGEVATTVLTSLAVTGGTDVETYTSAVSFENTNYTVSNPSTSFTILKAAVSFEIKADGTVTAYVSGDALDSGKYSVTYTDAEGTPVAFESLVDGEYTVSVSLNDSNYYISGTSSATTADLGTYTVGDSAVTNTAYFGTDDDAGTEAQVGSTIIIPGDPNDDEAEGTFMGWEYKGVVYGPGDMFVMPTGTVEFTPVYEELNEVEASVTDSEGNDLANVVITLMQGSEVIAETRSDENGDLDFSDVPDGIYNMVTTYDGIIVTTVITVPSEDAISITLPDGKTNTVVSVAQDVPAIVASGLDTEFTDDEKTAAANGSTIQVVMTIASAVEHADIAAAGSDYVDLYLDITVDKYTDGSGVNITETEGVQEIIVPYDFSGKTNVTVYRCHDIEVETFTKNDTKEDGTYILDTTNGLIYIYAQKFSTYAVGYDTPKSSSSSSSSASTYTITVTDTDNGSVSVSNSAPTYGTTVTITATADDGYAVGTITATTATGTTVTVTDNGDGTYSFTQPSSKVTISITYVAEDADEDDSFFIDVDEDDWFYDAVVWAVENGVTTGKTTTTFAPWDINTRAEAVTFLWRSMGEPEYTISNPFTDLEEDSFYYDAVLWAIEEGITIGTSTTTFSPYMDCSRAHIITFLWRMMGEPVVESDNIFTDVAEGIYYYDAVLWAVENGITTGTSDTEFSPDKDSCRVEIVTFLYRTSNMD